MPARIVDAAPMSHTEETRRCLALCLMVASGFAALGYQIVWTQQCALWLGNESAAVLAVVAAFFGGIALGALMLGPRIDRSAHPARWYAACEAVIGFWGLLLIVLMPAATGLLVEIIGAEPAPAWQWTVAFCGTLLLLLPATAAMGATLPAMERALAQLRREGANIPALYAGNTLGAVLGVLGAAFWLVPEFGLVRTAAVCMTLNLLCAAVAPKLFVASAKGVTTTMQPAGRGVLMLLGATGFLGIGYEVLVIRVLSQVSENTVYTFAILLAVYLVGTAFGAAAYDRWLPHLTAGAGGAERLRDRLLHMLAAACVLGTLSLAAAASVKAAVLQALGPGMAVALGAEAALATAAFLLPTIVMGMLFSHLSTTARACGIGFGRSLGVNTLGAAAAPLLFGVVLVPALGPRFALLLVAAGYLALSPQHIGSAQLFRATAAAILALAIWGPALRFVDVPEGGRLVSYNDGAMAAVSVVEDGEGISRLHINNRQQEGSSATLLSDGRQALLPLLLHPSPRRALFLGLGTGVTASIAADDPLLEVDAVELLPEVIDASPYFVQRSVVDGRSPRLHVMTADARRFVRAAHTHYDIIVSDNFHPARSGSGSLYTVEHFEAVRGRLSAGGLFCQWLPLHQLDLETLRSIVRAFISAYPDGWAMLATNSLDTPVVGLVARNGGDRFNVERVRTRLASVAMQRGPAAFGIIDDLALLGMFIAGPRALARFAGNAPLNTDDHPIVAYRAPRITYVPDSLPRDRLVALLSELEIGPDELLIPPADRAWTSRLSAYWSARNRYIDAGRNVQPTHDLQRMLSQVRAPLLSVLSISPDFRPAYDPLLRIATALGSVDVAAARVLLTELREAQPSRPEAAQALRDLSGLPR